MEELEDGIDGIELSPGFVCEFDHAGPDFTVLWPDGRWLVCFESGKIIAGSSPARVTAVTTSISDILKG